MEAFDQGVKEMALKLYEEKGIIPSCERCFYLKDPRCPNFKHICELERGLEDPEQRDWILENLPRCIEMRKRATWKPMPFWRFAVICGALIGGSLILLFALAH